MNTASRRRFLQAATATLLAAPAVNAIQPLGRTGKARLQLSLAAYSFREFFTNTQRPGAKNPPPADQVMDMFKFIDYCAAHDCDGAELTSYFFPKELSTDYTVKVVDDDKWPSAALVTYGTVHTAMQDARLTLTGFTLLRARRNATFNYRDQDGFWHIGGIYRIDVQD